MKILAVEDDLASRRILQAFLEKSGHECIVAENGVQAWEQFLNKPVDVVVSDWMMPEMDGLELCRKIRTAKGREYTYFILLTARGGEENFKEAMDSEVDDFLTKPLRRQELNFRLRVADRMRNFNLQIGKLKSLLPICMYCKSIRNDSDYWQQIDQYIHKETGTDFTHGICPDCYQKVLLPEIDKLTNTIARGEVPGQPSNP